MIRDTRRQHAYDHIRAKILLRGVGEGDRLAEIPIARELGISRTPVREALNQLTCEGLLERNGWGVTVKTVSYAELEEILRLRLLMEPHATARAAKFITDAQMTVLTERFNKLRSLYRQIWDAGVASWRGELGKQLAAADMLFHVAILEAARSPRMMQTILDMRLLTTRFLGEPSMQRSNLIRILREHWRIYREIRRRRPRAAHAAMRRHARNARRFTLRSFRDEQRSGDVTQYTRDWSASLASMLNVKP